MPEQIYLGNYPEGLTLNRTAFAISNVAFPTLRNFYVWRGRVKRKRGTAKLGRLQVQVQMVAVAPLAWQDLGPNLVAGAINLRTALGLQANSDLVPKSISLVVGANTYTEPSTPNGTLVGVPGGSGTVNYATTDITIAGGAGLQITGTFSYYPDLPVMGLEDFVSNAVSSKYPLTIAFDTTYAYQVNQTGGESFYNVSYYKGTNNPVFWSNSDDSQFWTTNYQSAFWATNNKPGLHLLTATYVSGTTTTALTFTFTTIAGPFKTLIVGDKLWFNEFGTPTTLNGVTGTVTTIVNPATGTYIVTFAAVQTSVTSGIVMMLTNSLPGQDGIRWYDGDPTNRTGLPTGSGLGWVNFCPPLTATNTSINDLNPALYYLVGALSIIPFKDRLIFFGPQIQSSAGVVYQRPIQDTVIYSWNGTPYYSALVPTSPTTTESFDPTAYYVDQAGKGGYQSAGISQPALTFVPNGDVYLVGFGGTGKKTRLVYTGNDIQPFIFYLINSEMPSSATFSGITMDEGMLDIGQYGLCFTTQQSAERADTAIPDNIFQIQAPNNGVQRVNSVRDFYRELIFWTYPTGSGSAAQGSWKYPNTTLLFNYRDNTWAFLDENWTAQGTYREGSNRTWMTLPFKTWAEWREPWNAATSQAQYPTIVCGNPQGYVLKRTDDTGEAPSGDIQAVVGNLITSVNHCVNVGDFLFISGAIGNTSLNGIIVRVVTLSGANQFYIDTSASAGTYLGLGTYTRLVVPLLQTKQFQPYWQQGRQVRLGVQKYLLDNSGDGQITVNIYLNQDANSVFNADPIYPDDDSTNESLVQTQLLYTGPEPGNLQMQSAASQAQIWHRLNTSLIGDTFQIGLTLSPAQMKDVKLSTAEIVLHGMQLTIDKGPTLS